MSLMNRKTFPLGFSVLVLSLVFISFGCGRREEQNSDPESIFTIKDGQINIDTTSPMMKYLELAPVSPSHVGSQNLKAVGQIIALANYSDQLVGSPISWVELDPDLSNSLGFHFNSHTKASVGEAFGVVSLPEEYLHQLKQYESVSILRYGLLESHTSAQVISIQPTKVNGIPVEGEPIQVVFKIMNGQDWYPGTNCVVSFPMLGTKPLLVPSTALLHEGQQEYLLQQVGQGEFKPKPVYVLDTLTDTVLVIGKLQPGDIIIGRGSILLKPILHRLLRAQISDADLTNAQEPHP
jgi:hypothetical protein